MIRLDSSLHFLNNDYFQQFVSHAVESHPNTNNVLLVADGVNSIDSSGEWVLKQVFDNLKESGFEVYISGLKKNALETIQRTGLTNSISEEKIFRNTEKAIETITGYHHEVKEYKNYEDQDSVLV